MLRIFLLTILLSATYGKYCCVAGEDTTEEECMVYTDSVTCKERKCKWLEGCEMPPPSCCCRARNPANPDEVNKCCDQEKREECGAYDFCEWDATSPTCNPSSCCCTTDMPEYKDKCCAQSTRDKCTQITPCHWQPSCDPPPPSCCCVPNNLDTNPKDCCPFGDPFDCTKTQRCKWNTDSDKCPDCCCQARDPSLPGTVATCCDQGSSSEDKCKAVTQPVAGTIVPICYWHPEDKCTKPPECCCAPMDATAPISEFKRCCQAQDYDQCKSAQCLWKDTDQCPRDCCCKAKQPWDLGVVLRCCKEGATQARCSALDETCEWAATPKCQPHTPCCCKPTVTNPSDAHIDFCCDLNDPNDIGSCATKSNDRCSWDSVKCPPPPPPPGCCCKPSITAPTPAHVSFCCNLSDGNNPDTCPGQSNGRCRWDNTEPKCDLNCCCQPRPGVNGNLVRCCDRGFSKDRCEVVDATGTSLCVWSAVPDRRCKTSFVPL